MLTYLFPSCRLLVPLEDNPPELTKDPIPMKKILTNSRTPFFSVRCIKILLLAIPFSSVQSGYGRTGSSEYAGTDLDYEPDGHYWTVLVVTTLLNIQHAKEIAYSAEFPDNVINKDGYYVRSRPTFLLPGAQKRVHALTGGNPENERNISLCMLQSARTPKEIGTALHRLGDSFAHTNDKKGRMYPHLIGHTLLWKKPDKIQNNPDKYLLYVHTLIKGLGGNVENIDMSVFNYIAEAGLDTDANCAILKAEYNLISGSIAFLVEEDQLPVVEKYLQERLSPISNSYALQSSTDGKGRITSIIILTHDLKVAKAQLSGQKTQTKSVIDQ